jgi:hypothetical protein
MVREDMEKLRSPRVHLVVDAYAHALTAKFPHNHDLFSIMFKTIS